MEVNPAMNRVNFYTGAGIDRVSPLRRDADWIANRLASPNARVLPVWREKNFVSFLDQGGKTPEIAWLNASDAASLANDVEAFVLLGKRKASLTSPSTCPILTNRRRPYRMARLWGCVMLAEH